MGGSRVPDRWIPAHRSLAGQLRFLSHGPRRPWLSAGGGVSVAYAFLHLLPELHMHHEVLRQAVTSAALAGFDYPSRSIVVNRLLIDSASVGCEKTASRRTV